MTSRRGRSPLPTMVAYFSLLLPAITAAQLPSVASINLCTDQLVLNLADPQQILSLSWLSADPEESMLADQASQYPLNYGTAEELLILDADVIIAGSQTSPFTRQLLTRLGSEVISIEPAMSIADITRNLAQVGAAIGQSEKAQLRIAQMHTRTDELGARRPALPAAAIVVRPGGFTVGRNTLAFELLELAGLENSVAELDRWGSLSVETLLRQQPEYIVLTDYRNDEASLANSVFRHPALQQLHQSQKTLSVESRYFSCGAPESLHSTAALLQQMSAN